jgi:glucoamylase
MYLGKPTGAAMPLMWAHSEYVRLLRSVRDGQVFDLVRPVADRYLHEPRARSDIQVWKVNRQMREIASGQTTRFIRSSRFMLRWTPNSWDSAFDVHSTATSIGLHYVDLEAQDGQSGAIEFTFFWTDSGRWEDRNYSIRVAQAAPATPQG